MRLPYRIVVTGSRDWTDRHTIVGALINAMSVGPGDRDFTIIQGGAGGADAIAAQWAHERQIRCESYVAEWDKHGKAAGPIRNREMLAEGADLVLAFPVGGVATSPGTWDCIHAAAERGVAVRIFPRGIIEETRPG